MLVILLLNSPSNTQARLNKENSFHQQLLEQAQSKNKCGKSSCSTNHKWHTEGDKQCDGSFLCMIAEQFKYPKTIIHTRILTLLRLLNFCKTLSSSASIKQEGDRKFVMDFTVNLLEASKDHTRLSNLSLTLIFEICSSKDWKSSISSSFRQRQNVMDHEEETRSQCSATVPLGRIAILQSWKNRAQGNQIDPRVGIQNAILTPIS